MEISKNVKVLENKMNENVRNYSFDVLRILACFLVIVNHTIEGLFKYFPSKTGYLSFAVFYFCKIAVPIFLMISGALLIPKEESLKKLFFKRIFRMIIILLVFSFVSGLIYKTIAISSTRSILTFLKSLLIKPIWPYWHLWYLYAYTALLFSLPIIRKMCSSMNKKDYYYYFICWIVFSSFLPFIAKIKGFYIYGNIIPAIFSSYLGCFIIGHFLVNIIKPKMNKQILISIITIFCVSILVNILYTINAF